MPTIDKQVDPILLESELHERAFDHLQVRPHGSLLVIFFLEEGERVNRARLTKVSVQYVILSIADHRGMSEATPFHGTMTEIVTLLTEQFSFALVPWS